MLKLPNCIIRIGRYSVAAPGREFFIEIIDNDSRCRVIEATMSAQDYADALTNRQGKCAVEVNDSGVLGKVREHKAADVFVPDGNWRDRKQIAAQACAVFEVDGWEARYDDALNGHNILSREPVPVGERPAGCFYKVIYERWVAKNEQASEPTEKPAGPPAAAAGQGKAG